MRSFVNFSFKGTIAIFLLPCFLLFAIKENLHQSFVSAAGDGRNAAVTICVHGTCAYQEQLREMWRSCRRDRRPSYF